MRLKSLAAGELRFLWRYGVVALYGLFTLIYVCLLLSLPAAARGVAAAVLVFTDPAAMGLFFMGAVVLLEKSQRVESSLSVSPITDFEYIAAKLLPMLAVGVGVGAVLCLCAGGAHMAGVLVGVALASLLFSLCGLAVGCGVKTLTGFAVAVVPVELFMCVPALLYLFGVVSHSAWTLHPGVAALRLISGGGSAACVLSLLCWLPPAYLLCKKAVAKALCTMGGARI